METLSSIESAAHLVVWFFLASLGGVVAMQLLTGAMNTRHLFHGRRADGTTYFSPERVQLLAITTWVALNYLLTVMNNPAKLPDVDTSTLQLLGGSHLLYLGGKAFSRFAPMTPH